MTQEDPIVAEVRASRKIIENACKNDAGELYQRMLVLQNSSLQKLVTQPLPTPIIKWSFEQVDLPDNQTRNEK